MEAGAGPSRPPVRRSTRGAARPSTDAYDISRLAGMDVDANNEGVEFGAPAFSNPSYDDGDDSDASEPDWNNGHDSDAGELAPTRPMTKKPSSQNRGGTKRDQLKAATNRPPAQNRPEESDYDLSEEDDEDEDEDEDDGSVGDIPAGGDMDTDSLDPALFGGASSSRPRNAPADREEAIFEPESFRRLVSSLQDTSREAGALRQRWDTSIEAENAEFENELRAAAGFKQKRRVRRKAHEQPLSSEVQALMADVNLAYVENRLHDAIPKLEEVIRIEPSVMAAWNTLGLIYEELKEEEKSIQCRIIGAHLQPRASGEWKTLAYRSIKQTLYRQAIYCFQQAIKIDKTDVDSIWDRALLLRDLGDLKAAISGMLDILKLQPYDASVVRELVPMLVSTHDYDRGIEVLERWRASSMQTYPDPVSQANLDPALFANATAAAAKSASAAAPATNNFQVSELVTLADLLLLMRKPLETISVVRQTARWLDGRASEDFWDAVDDDREFDADIDPLIRKERDSEGYGRQVETAEPHMLDPEIRLRLGKARMMLGDVAEAKQHFDVLTEGDPGDMPQIFAEIGDCYYEHKLWAEALDVLTDLADTDYAKEDVSLYAKLAACFHALGELEEAARLYEPVIEAVPDMLEWQMRLAEVYEGLGDKEKSLEVLRRVMQILQLQRATDAPPGQPASSLAAEASVNGGSMSFFDEIDKPAAPKAAPTAKRARMNYNRQQRLKLELQREQETQLSWRRLELLEPYVFIDGFWRYDTAVSKEGEESLGSFYSTSESAEEREKRYRQTAQWLEEAGGLIDAFRLHPRLNGHHLKRKRVVGAKMGRRNGRQRPSDVLPTTLASMLSQQGGRHAISTQARNLLHRLQDSLVEDDGASDLHDGSEAGEEGGRPKAEPGPKQLDMAKFRGVAIEQWIGLFAKYSFLLVKTGEPMGVVSSLLHSLHTSAVVWSIWERMIVVQLAWLSCALYARDWATVWSSVRWMAQEMQFHNLPLKLAASLANGTGFHSLGRLISNNDIKFYQRRMRQAEAVARGAPCRFSTNKRRWQVPVGVGTTTGREEDWAKDLAEEARRATEERELDEEGVGVVGPEEDEARAQSGSDGETSDGDEAGDIRGDRPEGELALRLARPTKPSPVAEIFYGYMLLYSGGYQSSAAFFGRAYAIQPTDALLSLVAGVAFLSRSTNRQTDNRHHMVLTATTFLQNYRRHRAEPGDRHAAEVEYNAGRFLHHIGLTHMAEKHYTAVLEMPSHQGAWDLKREAAWNLSLIYTTSNNTAKAQQLYDRYLTI